jgi:hypothetical protein
MGQAGRMETGSYQLHSGAVAPRYRRVSPFQSKLLRVAHRARGACAFTEALARWRGVDSTCDMRARRSNAAALSRPHLQLSARCLVRGGHNASLPHPVLVYMENPYRTEHDGVNLQYGPRIDPGRRRSPGGWLARASIRICTPGARVVRRTCF